VFVYGESAGGTLAALLGEDELVEAGASYSQVTDLPAFVRAAPDPEMYAAYLRASPAEVRRSSPDRGSIDVPFLAVTGAYHLPGFARETRRWAERNPSVRTRTVPGAHVGDQTGSPVYTANAELVLEWLARRAGLEAR
jgi:pimeloyl-ACP methyl ester carboxylesterase